MFVNGIRGVIGKDPLYKEERERTKEEKLIERFSGFGGLGREGSGRYLGDVERAFAHPGVADK